MIEIIEPTDELRVDALKIVLYGEVGIGKTTLAQQVENSFILDFDNGLHRSIRSTKGGRVNNWEDANNFVNSSKFDSMGIRCIIIDTAGTMLDNYMANFLINENRKLYAMADGQLSLKGYGSLKNCFKTFNSLLVSKGIDVIYVCHSDEKKNGDSVKYVPRMTGGSYNILMAEADMVGYMKSINDKRTINFSPTDENVGKNTAEFGLIEIPHYSDDSYRNFMGKFIEKTKDKISQLPEQQKNILSKIDQYKDMFINLNNEQLENVLPEINNQENIIKMQVLHFWNQRYFDNYKSEITSCVTPDDFKICSETIKNMPKEVQNLIRSEFKKNLEEKNVFFNKETKQFEQKKDNKKEFFPPKQENKPGQEVQIEPEEENNFQKQEEEKVTQTTIFNQEDQDEEEEL